MTTAETSFPRPMGLFDEEPDTTYHTKLGFTDKNDHQLASKLYRTWCLYAKLLQDERLWCILNEPQEKDTDMFCLQNSLVSAVNELGHVLHDVTYHLNRLKR